MMIDAHIHIDKGELSIDRIIQFIDKAVELKIDEIYLLQHTNVFSEYMFLYQEMKNYNEYQRQWVEDKEQSAVSIMKYLSFIQEMKKLRFPIKVKFGLEVCYSENYEQAICDAMKAYPFDFFVGSIHTIDGWAFSHIKQKWSTDNMDIEYIYKRYYSIMLRLVKSKLFSGLAHPNSLSCYGATPISDLKDIYIELAKELNKSNMYVEMSSGLNLNYGAKMQGMNEQMLTAMKDNRVKILTASDAHKPEDVGFLINEMDSLIRTV